VKDDLWEKYWKQYSLMLSNPFNLIRLKQSIIFYKWLESKFDSLISILDAGSGTGISSIAFAMHRKKVVLLDTSLEALKTSKKFYNFLSLEAEFIQADLFKMPFKRDIFNIVHNRGVLEHFNSKDCIRILSEMSRVGRIISIVVPYWRNIGYQLAKSYCQIFNKTWPFGENIERDYEVNDLIREFKEADIKVKFIKKFGQSAGIEAIFGVFLTSSPFSLFLNHIMQNFKKKRFKDKITVTNKYILKYNILIKLSYLFANLTGSKDSLQILGVKR